MWIIKRITALLIIVYVCADSGYAQTNDTCELEQFRCYDGQCIQSDLLCDGIIHCDDQSDETERECKKPEIICPDYAFRCNYGACVNRNSLCNGVADCADNSDETQPRCKSAGSNNQTVLCKVDDFTCNSGQCISDVALCDGTRDCADGSDETFERCRLIPCAATAFRCNYGACIDGDLLCNGVFNCADRSDEGPEKCGITWPSLPTVTTTTTSRSVTPTPTRPTVSLPPLNDDKCRAPPQPRNGRWKLHQSLCPSGQDCDVAEGRELNLGSRIVYSCNPGYRLRGFADVSCTYQGIWLTIPVCTEIHCKGLSTPSTEARCTYNDEWVPCETPVLPRTNARLSCRNSYRRESTLLSTRRDFVRCNANGQWEPEPIRCIPVCGVPPADVTPLIINGSRANITEFPWHASLYLDYPDQPKMFFCGSSIVTEKLLITAAHCVYDENTRQIIDATKVHVVTGNVFRDYDSPLHDPRLVRKNRVKNIYITCNYLGLIGNYVWDIAILELEQPFVLSAWLVPVCIDDSGDYAVLEAGSYGKVAGFGRTATGPTSAILQSLTVPYVPFNQCKSASISAHTEQYLTTDKFCAGYRNGSSVCDGDSGGGLVFKTDGLWFLRGIVSVSLGTIKEGGSIRCDNNLYSLYTKISSHIAWIQEVISSIERNMPYSPCPNRP
ncbi:hypothetical protein DMN91_001794 [Ooceraea biroi]|uniref:Limulus clotting factor C n=1 Tax=Ooceraea biroi TaxID=2015173 RepID=A0A026WA21_OOCBI|nr:modular serine protease [Ooceraea biroi]EZA52823.1 Limulus clotting factor C [Ooceraea biroi]RLU25637.1 hypothetical protein DMN91_001794 [Ooceraea biroi]